MRQEVAGDVESALLVEFADAGGAGHVHLREVVAYDIEAHEREASTAQFRANGFGDFQIAGGQGPRDAASTGCQIASALSCCGDARKGERNRFSVYDQNAFVAVNDLWQVALGHDLSAALFGKGLYDHGKVCVTLAHPKDRRAAHPVQRFHHDVAMLGREGA